MKIIRRPTVYLVGRQTLDEREIARFLEDHDVAGWTTDTSTAAEILPEVAGRLCYMSFVKPRPGGNRSYLENIKESRHGRVQELQRLNQFLRMELHHHGCLPLVHPRACPPPHRLRLLAVITTICGRIGGGLRRAGLHRRRP